ncbi:MAG: hypothetical protein Q8P19_03560 [bacterium]|nr:hypothetical protein [bacterium]
MRIRFVVFDADLGRDVGDSILPHLRRQLPEAHIGFLSSDMPTELDGVDLLVNCMSAMHSDWSFVALNRAIGRMPCALIVRSANREHWRELSKLHNEVAQFRFLVAIGTVGGLRKKLEEMFPGLRMEKSIASDISDIHIPREKIANFIARNARLMIDEVRT